MYDEWILMSVIANIVFVFTLQSRNNVNRNTRAIRLRDHAHNTTNLAISLVVIHLLIGGSK